MLFPNLRDRMLKDKACQLYGAAVAQARQPDFYARLGVHDTPDGRLALISLHVLLVLDRLMAGSVSDFPGLQHTESGASDHPTGDIRRSSRKRRDLSTEHRLGQLLMEVFVEDLDQAMRELGIGDMGVSKRVKGAVAQFYADARQYRKAQVENGNASDLRQVLTDMVPGLTDAGPHAACLEHYVRATDRHLADLADQDLQQGRISFPSLKVMTTVPGQETARASGV